MPFIINGEVIDEDVIEAEFRQVKAHYERTLQVACCERDPEFRGYAKDNILSRVLLSQEALRRYPGVTDEDIDQRLAKRLADAGGDQAFFMNLGIVASDEPAIRPNIATGVRLDKTLKEVYHPEPKYSEEEMRAWHAAHPKLFMTDEMVRAAHITLNMRGAQSREEQFNHIRKVRRELLDGADFMTVAERERLDKDQQIDLGWFKRGEFMEEFEVIAFSMSKGEISPVFTTQLGLHLCLVLDRKDPEPKPFEEVKAEVEQRMLDEYRDQKFNEFLEQLKAAAAIEDTDTEEHVPDHQHE